MKFKVGDRVLIAPNCEKFRRQNKDSNGKEYAGTVQRTDEEKKLFGSFRYFVEWDKGARSESAYYNDEDLIPVATNNKQAKGLLVKEW